MPDSINTQVSLQSFTINGQDIKRHVNMMQVYEDINKPYLTASAAIIDRADIINNLNLVGGEDVSFTVQADGAGTYSANMKLHGIGRSGQNYSLRTAAYQMNLIGTEYFGDKQNLVQQSFKQITGTDIIKKIHSQYLGSNLNIPVPSIGLLAKDNAIIASSEGPFAFINKIRNQLMYGQYQTGSSAYFRDNQQVNLVPLEHLFSTLSSQRTFTQKATWGARWQDIFQAQNAIIAAETTRGATQIDMRHIASSLNQERKVIDIYSHKRTFNDMARMISPGTVAGTPIASLIQLPQAGGQQGGRQNYYMYDSEKIPKENVRQTDKEALYQAMLMSGPQIRIKVPAQGGFTCTIGKGFTARLMPPIGDQDTVGYDPQNSGDYLATHIMHDFDFDDHTPGGTTVIQGVKGGIQQ